LISQSRGLGDVYKRQFQLYLIIITTHFAPVIYQNKMHWN
jgi:hypothetical protein